MPRRNDISTILILGSGPIVIGQAAEFDYSGTQACRALRDEGYRIVLANSNPATIMTDPEFADATYIEPLTVEAVAEIIRRERPEALLPTLGGQTALNLAIELDEAGVLEEYDVELLGASIDSIQMAEDRQLFHDAMDRLGLKVPESRTVKNLEQAHELAARIGFPLIIRPSFTLGGKGGAVAYDYGDLDRAIHDGLDASPVGSALVEKSVARLERVRAGSHARPLRQRRYYLLHRKRRPDGRSHRRLHHHRTHTNPLRPPVPDPPLRLYTHNT